MKKKMISKSNTIKKSKDSEITPIVKSIAGVIKLHKDFDYKKEYAEYLYNKYINLK